MDPITLPTPGYPPSEWLLERLDFVTREEFIEAYATNQHRPRVAVYILAGLLAQGAALPLEGLPAYDMEPIAYGRAVYSVLRAAGVDRMDIIHAGNAAALATMKGIAPTDPEVAERQDFTSAGAA